MIVFVVGTHTLAYVPLEPSLKSIVLFVVHPIAVPVFFLVDGFLFTKHCMKNKTFQYKKYIVKSAKRLLLPWVLFSFMYFLCRLLFEYTGFLSEHLVIGKSGGEILLAIYTSAIAGQMYFLLSLFFIRLLSIGVRKVILAGEQAVILLFIIYLAFINNFHISRFFFEGLDPALHAFWGFQYYVFGIILFLFHDKVAGYARLLAFFSFIVLFVAKLTVDSTVLVQYSYILLAYTIFLSFANHENQFSRWGKYTMGVYLLHAPILLKIVSLLASKISNNGPLNYFMVLGTTFVLSLIMAKILNKYAYGRFLFGNA